MNLDEFTVVAFLINLFKTEIKNLFLKRLKPVDKNEGKPNYNIRFTINIKKLHIKAKNKNL